MERKAISQSSVGPAARADNQTIVQPQREKSKRPQLSCNSCRARKVKCDRVQPCTACSLHQIAHTCQYDLTELERYPILQAEALREKDKEIARLQHKDQEREKEIARLRLEIFALGGTSARPEIIYDFDPRPKKKSGLSIRGCKKPANLRQKKSPKSNGNEGVFLGELCLSNVIQDLDDLTFGSNLAGSSNSSTDRQEERHSHESITHPFPTLWLAKDGVSALIRLVPPREEVSSYLNLFQRRVSGFSFPHVPQECTRVQIERFMANIDHYALLHPDMLALMFATIAQGLRHGLYDRVYEDGSSEAKSNDFKKGDVFIAASVQALRLASFMSRPTLLVVQTLAMICPYLTDIGKIHDSWALLGITIRLAQAISLHRDPRHLQPCPSPEEIALRETLWWWIMHMDQQYSVTLGRPLGISNMADCPPLVHTSKDPLSSSLSKYHSKFTILARQILSAGDICRSQIDLFTDQLLSLRDILPDELRFQESWLLEESEVPVWPLNARAVSLHQETHNFVIFLNRQRPEENAIDSNLSCRDARDSFEKVATWKTRDRVCESCREILFTFEYFHFRVKAGPVCWIVCQRAFNAAITLAFMMVEHKIMDSYPLICRVYKIFREIQELGVHNLAGEAIDKIKSLLTGLMPVRTSAEKIVGEHDITFSTRASRDDYSAFQFGSSRYKFNGVEARAMDNMQEESIGQQDPTNCKPLRKARHGLPTNTVQKHKAAIKKIQRKDSTPQRRLSGGPWSRDGIQLNLMNAFSGPSTPTHSHNTSELPAADIQSTLEHHTRGSAINDSPVDGIAHGLANSTSSSMNPVMGDAKSWLYTLQSSPTNSTFQAVAPSSSVSAPSSYHPASYFQSNPNTFSASSSVVNSRPPSLHLSPHPSSSYANSFVSSLQTASGVPTPNASHPVSPSLSHSQQYCLSQPQTQPQSPVWGVGFDGPIECTDLSMGLATNEERTDGEGRTWWVQGWNQSN